MKKPIYFYLFLIGGVLFLLLACAILVFLVYFIIIGKTLDTLLLAIALPITAGIGVALTLYSLKILKTMSAVNTLISLYPNFIKTDSFEIHTYGFKRSQLLIDGINRQFIFILRDSIIPAYGFDDIISYAIYENGVNVFEKSRLTMTTEQYLGNVGTRGGNALSDRVISLHLIINVKDEKSPRIVISYVGLRSVDRLSLDYRDYINSINRLCVKLDNIMTK